MSSQDKISSFRLVRSVRGLTISSGNINDFRSILSTIFFNVRELLSSLSLPSMFLFRAACRTKKRKKKRGFHGKLFHRLANTVSSSLLVLVDLLLRPHFSNLQPVSRLFPRKHVGAGTIENFFSLFWQICSSWLSKNEKLHSDSSTYWNALTWSL